MDNPYDKPEPSARLTQIVEAPGEGFGFVDKNENFLFMNQVTAKIFDYTREEIIDQPEELSVWGRF